MIIKMGTPSKFLRTWFDSKMYKEKPSLPDGIYFSENKPISNDFLEPEVEYEFDTEKDSICFHADKVGYYTICMEND